ncbi:MAG: hypothetical protein JNL82_14530 [Myxococcales bacterium]|nr:hypothetical protein [Myxococcales bacterium]
MRRIITSLAVDPDYLALGSVPSLDDCVEVGGWRPCSLTLLLLDAQGQFLAQSEAVLNVELITVRGMLATVNGGPYELADRVGVLASSVAPGSLFVRVRSYSGVPAEAATIVINVEQLPIETAIQMALAAGGAADTLAALNTGTSELSRIKASAAAAIADASLADAGVVNSMSSTLSHVVDNIIAALNTGGGTLSRVKASAIAAAGEAWGALLDGTGTTSGADYVQLLAAPPAGHQHEIVSFLVTCEVGGDTDVFSFTSNDEGTSHKSFVLASGATASQTSPCPTKPLFAVVAGALKIQAAEGGISGIVYRASIIYRTVPTT